MMVAMMDNQRLLRHRIQHIKYEIRYYLGHFQAIFMPLMKLQRKYDHIMVDCHTDIFIEGYTRCGNTFAVAAFTLSQPAPVTIARHSHVPAQIFRAVALNCPTLVLIRNPHDAVLSTVIRHPFLSIARELDRYVDYYTAILPYREHYVVGEFQDVVSDFGCVIDKVNRHFGTGYQRFAHTEENVQRVFQAVEEMDKRDLVQAQLMKLQLPGHLPIGNRQSNRWRQR